ncbi:glutathione-dependent formaldehyde-activating enzyme [Ophiostoma piceae UAMH 11346]|uniref:Glutathione-dependent formaldehyde-activating enzyme n=1 Tax=Ophiostoma piceae (strain UAMH 11346) TaxID=1262450 RepID=S3DBB1_OPHP1|nr:glutathione-dependent formaldehyde-activating enzyme [Ophiostoma piceae UAMH 11346]
MYNGNCHCGAYRFEVDVDGDGLKKAVGDSSTPVAKLGALWLAVADDVFRVDKDDGKLVSYKTPSLEYQFCSECGSCVRGAFVDGPLKGSNAINIRALRSVNPFEIEQREKVESNVYPTKGKCICGAVQVELLSPLQDMAVKEDNCSICARNAWIGVYPSKAQVALSGTDNVQDYRFGRRFMGHPFCKTCGVHVYMNVYGPPQQVIDRLPEEKKEMIRKNLDMAPVNVRVLDGIQLDGLTVARTDEGTDGYEKSVLGLE